MLIAQISDLHLRTQGVRLFGSVDPFAALEEAVTHLNTLQPAPDVVIVSGDLVNDGGPEDYAALARLLQRLPMPIYAVPGNHDRRDLLREHLSFTGVLPEFGKLMFSVDDHPVRLIGLDTLVEGEHAGELGTDQLGWLDCELAAAPDRPTLMFLHHPPFLTGIGFMDRIPLKDTAALSDVVARHPQVGVVTAGHVHRAMQSRFAGTIAMTTPGTAHQVVLDLMPDSVDRWIAEPPACLLHLWSREAGFVSHLSYIGDHGSAQGFE
jgi:3',5'-cyclic AMP phosphodiesterase CpdA